MSSKIFLNDFSLNDVVDIIFLQNIQSQLIIRNSLFFNITMNDYSEYSFIFVNNTDYGIVLQNLTFISLNLWKRNVFNFYDLKNYLKMQSIQVENCSVTSKFCR